MEKEAQAQFDAEILAMLREGDEEFVPPLSVRSSTTQADLNSGEKVNGGVLNYFEALKRQRILVATEQEKLIAFVSFKEDYICEKIGRNTLPNIYVSTLLVRPDGRGKGLTRKMYTVLFDAYAHANIYTRTWSTNIAHIKILSSFGFEPLCILENDRGEGIDTVYFEKKTMQ